MTLSKSEFESIRELIPLYVKGLLTEKQKAAVEKSSDEHPELRIEIDQWRRILRAYQAIEETIPQPSRALYARIASAIRDKEESGYFSRFFASRKLSLAFMAAQFLIIIALSVYIVQMRPDYRTLSAPPSVITAGAVKIHIVFKESASSGEIKNLLVRVGARITDGPGMSGMYVVEIPSTDDADKKLDVLRNSTIVEFVEKSF